MTLPTASDANPPYPANHTFDPIPPEIVGTPPANHGVKSPGYAVGLPPSNHDLEAAAQPTGTPPANHDFATGDLSGWTTTGTVTIQSDATHGSYARLDTTFATLTTSAFTVDASSQTLAVELGFRSTSGIDRVKLAVLSGTGYTTVTEIGDVNCSGCASWVTRSMNASPWLGQSVKLRISAVAGLTGIDSARTEVSFPGYTLSGTVSPTVETSGNTFARLEKNGVLTTAAFTVDSSAQFLAIKTLDQSAQGGQFFLYVLSGAAYATETRVHINSNVPDTWTRISVNTSAWQGQSIKLQVRWQAAAFGVDDLGTQSVEIPDWQVESDAWLEPTTQAGDTGYVVSTNGDLTSQPFTIDASAQHLTLDYQSVINSIFYVKLLRGATFDQVVDLHGGSISGTASWQTLKLGIQLYAGETVKLTIEQYWGRGRYDNLGRQELVLPDWELATTQAVTTGEDAHGSWVQAFDRSAAYLLSGEIATGIIDGVGSDLRYYAVAYDIGYRPAEMVRIKWINTAGQSWYVFTDAQNSPTGYRTRYFWLADFMGTDGYFEVQIPDVGKVYSIADNIARQHLNEPFSESVGSQIDTATGSFGYQSEDLSVQGILPLIFTRYYAGHSDQYGVLGYRWTHSYDTRLVFGEGQDVGVVLGSGRELFYDWYTVFTDPPNRYVPADARIHDTLVKNGDGSYTFTTTTRLDYHFTSTGVLSSISDPNGNSVTLTYDTGGLLTTATDPVGRELDLVYDTNGRLATVTDPVGAVVTYGYDANGDLTTVTDPEGGVWSYSYDRHRLVSVTGPDAVTQFTNTLDERNRVVTQTLADDATLTIAYATPAKGVTSVTDPEGNTAAFYFDRHARTTHKVDPLNQTTEYQYDADGNRVRVIDPANQQWDFAYDGAGNLTTFTDATGNPLSIVYDAQHLPTTVTDPCGNQTTLAYDLDGNVASTTNELNETTSWTHNSRGQILTETNDLNQTTTYTYDADGNRTTLTDALNQVWSWTYDANGRVLTETDSLNQTTTYAYDMLGRLRIIRDHLGGEIESRYDLYGYLLWQEDQLDNRTNWQYDERGNVVTKADPAGKQWTYTWDANGQMLTQTDPNQHTTSYTYDDAGRLVSMTNALNQTTSRSYDSAGRLASVTDPLNRTITFGHDAAGRMTSTTLPNTGVLTATYDNCGNTLTTTDALSRTTTWTYDAANRKATETDPRGKTTSYAYDAAGRLETITNPATGVTDYGYDAVGRLVAVTDPLNQVTNYGYDAAGNQTTVTDPLNQTTTTSYDALNRVQSVTDPLNRTTSFTYDLAGRQERVTFPTGQYVDYDYDARGLLTAVTDRLGHVTSYTYDDAGQRLTVTDPNQHTTTYGYDAANRQTSITDALGGVVSFGYDAAGQQTSLTNARGKTTTATYNGLGLRLTETDPLNRTTTYSYDLAGQVTGVTDARGTAASYGYDLAGNLTSITYPGGGISNVFDDLNRRTALTDSTGTTNWVYDAANQVTSVTSPNGTVGYTYDAAGRRTSMTQPGNRTVSYGYDVADQLTSVTDWQNRVIAFDYNADGQRTGITRPNGVSSTYGYDLAGRLTSVIHGGGGVGSSQSYQYTLDAAGNRSAVVMAGGSETYTLDAINRLTNVTYANNDTAAYTYDANGNRLTETVNGALTHTYSYDDADQLTTDGTQSYTYDQSGNVLTAGSDTYGWDWTNQLTSATVNGATTTFAYDGDGARVSQTTGGATTSYLWDRETGLPLLIDDGTTAYLHAAGLQAEVDGANAASYPLSDALGSVRASTDGSGNVTSTRDYAVFGATRAATGSAGIFGFTGEQSDIATGLTYLRARYADPSLGRFLSADSVQPNAPGTQGYNRYSYTANNPTTWTDPSGHTVNDAMTQITLMNSIIAQMVALGVLVASLAVVLVGFGPIGAGIGLVLSFQFVALALILLMVIGLIIYYLFDPFDHYAGDPPLVRAGDWTIDQVLTAPQHYPKDPYDDCAKGTLEGVGEALLWGMLFATITPASVVQSGLEGCLLAQFDRGGGSSPNGQNIPKPNWVTDAGSFVNWMKNIDKAYKDTGQIPTKDELDEIVRLAQEFGVSVRLDPPHPGTPWNVPHINFGEIGAHVPVPPGYQLP